MAFFGDSGDCPERQMAFLNAMREHNVDGILISPAAGTDPEHLNKKLRQWRLPCVFYSRHLDDPDFDYVGCDNSTDMQRLTQVLIDSGHSRIALVGANDAISSGRERLRGFPTAMDRATLAVTPDLLVYCPSTRPEGYHAAHKLLSLEDRPTAIVCFNDNLAFGAMLAIQNAGLTVGQDMSVTGFDDVIEASLWRPGLATNRVPTVEIGHEVVRLLVERINGLGAPPVCHLIKGELKWRGSAGLAAG